MIKGISAFHHGAPHPGKMKEDNSLSDKIGDGYLCSDPDLSGFDRSRYRSGFHFCRAAVPVIVIDRDIDRPYTY
jgi:hypothetical protein